MARPDDERARYRKAAHETLDQLDWCVEYLKRIHKPRISRQLEINTSKIRRRVDEPDRGAVTRE
ncbi:MAG TPA: hypothetical protein VG057_09880 [Solirubrobacteraceae bacterium]|jgi:hypothetical protein|nr:hypothetical protein [Solirubrobacteraceae bacterium]